MSRDIELDFIVAGVCKAGTTSLYHYFLEHPEIAVSPKRKESNVYIKPISVLGKEIASSQNGDLQDLFDGLDLSGKKVGEVSPFYMPYHNYCIPELKKLKKQPKVIIVLRNPVDRLISHHNHNLAYWAETLDLRSALEVERQRPAKEEYLSIRLRGLSRYSEGLESFMNNFENVGVFYFDDFIENPEEFFLSICTFLGVDYWPLDLERHKQTGQPSNKKLNNLLNLNSPLKKLLRPIYLKILGRKRVQKLREKLNTKNLKKVYPDTKLRKELEWEFKPEIEKLELILKKDLSHWKSEMAES